MFHPACLGHRAQAEKNNPKMGFLECCWYINSNRCSLQKVAFTLVVCFFLEYKPICPFLYLPGSQFTTWQLGQIPPHLGSQASNGRSASDFISLVCDNLSVLLLTFYFSFVAALCAALHNIWFMHSNRLCITVVCDTKLPINLWEWRFETGHVHVHSALQQQLWCLWVSRDLLGLS